MNVCIQFPFRLPKMQDEKSLTLSWLLFSAWGQEHISLVFGYKGGQYIQERQWHTKVNTVQLAVGYLNATINRKTWIPQPEIGTDGSSQTLRQQQVLGYGSWFGPQRCSGAGLKTGLEPNRTVFVVLTSTACGLPGPVANTCHHGQQSDCSMGKRRYNWCPSHVYQGSIPKHSQRLSGERTDGDTSGWRYHTMGKKMSLQIGRSNDCPV